MDRVFNMGIGLILVVAEYYADAIVRHLNQRGANPGLDHRRGRPRRSECRLGC